MIPLLCHLASFLIEGGTHSQKTSVRAICALYLARLSEHPFELVKPSVISTNSSVTGRFILFMSDE